MEKIVLVSIIVPVYNAGAYLVQCLDSLISQTLEDIEIVIVNDGSTDNSFSIIQEYNEKYNNIKVISQENKGVVEARIIGYENAVGEYIGWVDADDFVDERMFEILYSKAKENDADMVSCNMDFYSQGNHVAAHKAVWFKEYKGVVDWKFIERNTNQCNKIVRKTLLEKLNIVDLFRKVGEGCYENVLIATRKIITVNECLYHYRVGHISTSSSYDNYEWYLKHITKSLNQYNIIQNSEFRDEYIDYFKYRVYYSVILAMLILSLNSQKDKYMKCKHLMKAYDLQNNSLNKEILKYNYGFVLSIVFRYIVPNSFYVTRILARIYFRNK